MPSDSTAAFASADLQEIQASNGITYAFRRVGTPSPDGIPLVLWQHFRGNIDNWDPTLVDGLAAERDVIAFDNAGVGGPPARLRTPPSRWPMTLSHSSTRWDFRRSTCLASRSAASSPR